MKSVSCSLFRILALLLALSQSAHAAADYATPYVFSTLAGVSSIGDADGTGASARFYSPKGVATDSTGNVFIVDEGNHTIRKMTPAGVVSTFVGSPGVPGSADGTGAEARFDSPQSIVADATDNLYVTDTGNHTIRKITPAGVVTTLAGLAGVTGKIDGIGSLARFNRPLNLAVDATGNLYVTEAGNGTIRKISPFGNVSTFADRFSFPEKSDLSAQAPVSYGAIAIDTAGNVYVSTHVTTNYNLHAPNWEDNSVTYFGSVDLVPPTGIRTSLWQTSVVSYVNGRVNHAGVSALAVDSNGQLIAASGYRVVRYVPADHSLAPIAGDGLIGGSDGTAATAKFGFPLALSFARDGTLYVADTGNNVVRKLSPAGDVSTLAGLALERATGISDGTGSTARFNAPTGAAVDADGNVFVADASAHCIRKITPAGVVTTFAGAPGTAGSADGTGTAARFSRPTGVAIGAGGALFVTDGDNHTIRRITPTGETSTFAGSPGTAGYQDGQGSAALFWNPRGIAMDGMGYLYVTSASTVRRISPAGETTTLAGLNNEAGYVDDVGTSARFIAPSGVTVDASGNVYVTEAPFSPAIARIRKITPTGRVTTLAGAEQGYADGTLATARFHEPRAIGTDDRGNLYVADSYNQTIRKIWMTGDPAGTVTTLAGLADAPGGSDGTGRAARFFFPQGIAVDILGRLYVTSGTTVRKGERAIGPSFTTVPASQTVNAGSSTTFSVTATGTPAPTYQWHFNGTAISGATSSSLSLANVRASDAGDYTVVATNDLGSVTSAKATLTVNTPAPPPPPAPGGGGGGAPSWWALAALAGAGLARRLATASKRQS
ncbi:MAG: immunoglobulin domain-containing protein [Opitutae bacterium]|nr:immunoglobulin domain-containing protein [Opitutae bacterium]